MKYTIITFLLFLNASLSFAQASICVRDTVTIAGELLTKIIDESQSGVTIRFSNSKEEHNAKRLCQHSYETIDSLNNLLTGEQIEQLFICENTAVKAVGFILYCNRNPKDEVIARFNELLNGRTGFMTSSCSDAIRTTSFQQFCFELLIHQNLLFRPEFRLTKKEKEKLTIAIQIYEEEFWKK